MKLGAAIFLVVACAIAQASAAGLPGDADLQKQIVGSWMVAADSPDHTAQSDHMFETFRADGSYALYLFPGSDCHGTVKAGEAKWTIVNGVLISTYADGSEERDQILSFADGRMSLRAADGEPMERVKNAACEPPSI